MTSFTSGRVRTWREILDLQPGNIRNMEVQLNAALKRYYDGQGKDFAELYMTEKILAWDAPKEELFSFEENVFWNRTCIRHVRKYKDYELLSCDKKSVSAQLCFLTINSTIDNPGTTTNLFMEIADLITIAHYDVSCFGVRILFELVYHLHALDDIELNEKWLKFYSGFYYGNKLRTMVYGSMAFVNYKSVQDLKRRGALKWDY